MSTKLGVVALLIVLTGCGHGSTLQVFLGPAGTAKPVPPNSRNNLLDRNWTLHATLRIVAPDCIYLDDLTETHATFNGFPRESGDISIGQGDDFEAYGSPGVRLRVDVHVSCSKGKPLGASSNASRVYRFPSLSCVGGLVRVLALSGSATYKQASARKTHPLHVGYFLRPSATVDLGGSVLKVGAPECNGFTATLSGGVGSLPTYDTRGRGSIGRAHRVVLTGDAHTGPIALFGDGSQGVWVGIPGSRSTVETLTNGTMSVVRVDAGRAVVHGVGTPVLLRANERAFVSRSTHGYTVRCLYPHVNRKQVCRTRS